MKRSIICLAAGKADRFNGTPKHELIVEGEKLIDRTRRLFGDVKLIVRSDMLCTLCTCDTLLQSKKHWGGETIVLLGDVFYTPFARDSIMGSRTDLAFFTDLQDIFAVKFGARWIEPFTRLIPQVIRTLNNNGRLWELYRAILGLPVTATLPHKGNTLCIQIADQTQDFDTEEELDLFKRGFGKNKIMFHKEQQP